MLETFQVYVVAVTEPLVWAIAEVLGAIHSKLHGGIVLTYGKKNKIVL